MKDYISIAGQQIELTQDQLQKLTEALGIQIQEKALAEYKPGDTVKIGGFEMVVLEQHGTETSLILKDTYGEDTSFGDNNNYVGSAVDKRCMEFEKELADLVGEENIVSHTPVLDPLRCAVRLHRQWRLLQRRHRRPPVFLL